jgi:hypothetical protein
MPHFLWRLRSFRRVIHVISDVRNEIPQRNHGTARVGFLCVEAAQQEVREGAVAAAEDGFFVR